MNQPEISILVATHNRLDLTRRCFASLAASLKDGPTYEVIVVDDCSTDGTPEFLNALGDPYRILHNDKLSNFALNNNRAAAIAEGEILCFLNNDTILKGAWWKPMLDALEQYQDAGCVGNVQLLETGRYDHFGICFPPWLTPLHYGQNLKEPPYLGGAYSRWGAVTGACLMIKRERFFEVEGFNSDYINGCEDVDLCLRLHQKGYWHYVAHFSEIIHIKGASPGRKIHNAQNLQLLKATHRIYLEENLVTRDARIAAISYLNRVRSSPLKTNLWKLIRSLATIIIPLKSGLKNPDCT
jgi:GT2 family glycosyltransferase